MKKIISSAIFIIGSVFIANAQNTIPTTTVTGALKINDSLNVNKNITAKGEVIVKDTLRAKKDILVDGNAIVNGKLKVDGNAKFKDDVKLTKGFTFDGTNGITSLVNGNNRIINYGNIGIVPRWISCAAAPSSLYMHSFGGTMQVYDPTTAGTGGTVLNLQTWLGGSSIDASTDGHTSNSNLLLNYFCGNNVGICTGQYGGIVSMGKNVEIGFPNPSSNNNVALNIKAAVAQNTALQIMDANNKINFKVKNDGFVYAREINVMPTNINFPDYVFAKNYKLMALNDVEVFVKNNMHLPNIPSAKEVEANGINISELQIKQMEKIEELYLHLIELKKENDSLKSRIESLENKHSR